MTIRGVPVQFQSPSENGFRFIRLSFQVQQVAHPKLRRSAPALAKLDRGLESLSGLLLAAHVDFRYSELGEGFVIFGKCFDRLCEMAYAPRGVVLGEPLHAL